MTSAEQAASNKSNAQKSTGPRTQRGKQASRRNAEKHRVFSRDMTIPGEDLEAFHALLDSVVQEYDPVGPIEDALVNDMATARLRLERVASAEGGMVRRRLNELEARQTESGAENLHRDLEELEKEVDYFNRPERKGDSWVSAERSVRLNRERIQRRLRRTAEGVRHLIETVDQATREVQRGSLTNTTRARLHREFTCKGFTLVEYIYVVVPQTAEKYVSQGPDAGSLIELSSDQRMLIFGILAEEKGRLTATLEEAEQNERQAFEAAHAEAAVPNEAGVALIGRYQTMCERQFYRALDHLERLQRQRREQGKTSSSARK